MAATRIYCVREEVTTAGKNETVTKYHLVRASSQAKAINHVAQLTRFTAQVAEPDELVALVQEGHKVEEADEGGAS